MTEVAQLRRKIANLFFEAGDSIEKIARVLHESEETVIEWIKEKN